MTDKKYASPLHLEIKHSRRLLLAVLLVHLGAFIMLAISNLPWQVNLILVVCIAVQLWMFLAINDRVFGPDFLNRLLPRFKQAVWIDDNSWCLTDADGNEVQAQLLATSFVLPQLTIVNLKLLGKPWYLRYRSLVFLRDNLDAEIFRRLRVRLRWYSTPVQDNSVVPE